MAKTSFDTNKGSGKASGTRAVNPKDTRAELTRLRRPAKAGTTRPMAMKKGGMVKKKSK